MTDRSSPRDPDEKVVFPKTWDTPPGSAPQRSDDAIRRDIEDRLFYHPDVRSIEVRVEVVNGVVTLSGTVDDDVERMVCEDIARTTPGVREIRDNLEVRKAA